MSTYEHLYAIQQVADKARYAAKIDMIQAQSTNHPGRKRFEEVHRAACKLHDAAIVAVKLCKSTLDEIDEITEVVT